MIPSPLLAGFQDKWEDFEEAVDTEDYGLAEEIIRGTDDWFEEVVAQMRKKLTDAQK